MYAKPLRLHSSQFPLNSSPRSVLPASQLAEIRFFAETLEMTELALCSLGRSCISRAVSGIYVFLRAGGARPRLYLGMSEADLFERICKQKYLRRWAVFILVFEMPGLHRNTLEILERRLLHLGRMWFPEAIWDNILGLSPFAQSLSSAWNTCPDLDSLAQMIIEQVRRKVPHASKGVYRPCLPPTHSLGSPCHEVHGLAHRKGRWTYLLPGSRVSSLYPNFAAIERDRIAFAILSKFYWEGMIAWRKGTRKRPAGMAVVETILFRSGGEAEKFLFAGGTVAEKLHRVMER